MEDFLQANILSINAIVGALCVLSAWAFASGIEKGWLQTTVGVLPALVMCQLASGLVMLAFVVFDQPQVLLNIWRDADGAFSFFWETGFSFGAAGMGAGMVSYLWARLSGRGSGPFGKTPIPPAEDAQR